MDLNGGDAVAVETVEPRGVVTANVSSAERRYLNPETLPQAPTGYVVIASE